MSLNFEVQTLDFKLTHALNKLPAQRHSVFRCHLVEGNSNATICNPSTLREPEGSFQGYDD
jgi:hypothetical protein